jgi:hypothetical protein
VIIPKTKEESEIEFVKNFFVHKNWIHRPASFKINGEKYNPDFYDGKRNVFIEVSETRQAFHNNKEKYKEFRKIFPLIKLEIRAVNGDLIDLDAEKQHIQNNST